MNKWLLGVLAAGLVVLLAWLFLPALPFFHRAPQAKIYADPLGGVTPLTVQLSSIGANPHNEELQLEWTVDGTVVSDKSSFHQRLETAGQHTITLKVTDRRGKSSTDSVTVNVAQLLRWTWSEAGPVPNMHCVVVSEPSDPDSWADNNLCTTKDIGLQWSAAGPIAGMRCTQIADPGEPEAHGWTDNYLCLPESAPRELHWSTTGRMKRMGCIQITESADHNGWKNDWLCYSRKPKQKEQTPAGSSQP